MKIFGIKLLQGKSRKLKQIHKSIIETEVNLIQVSRENQEVLQKINIAKQDLQNKFYSIKKELQEKVNQANDNLSEINQDITTLKKEQAIGNPHLANLISEYFF